MGSIMGSQNIMGSDYGINVSVFTTLCRGMFLLIQIVWITSPYNVHVLLIYTGCLSQRERYTV
jgi:hypothetical protein